MPGLRFSFLKLAPLLAVIALTIAVYAQALGFKFVYWDDIKHLVEYHLLEGDADTRLAAIWSAPYYNFYIPLVYTVWWAVGQIQGLNPELYHGVNVLVHLVNVGLVFVLLSRLTREKWSAAFGAAVFALHPLQVESVVWVSGLRDTLAVMFTLLTVLLFGRDSRFGWKWIAASVAFLLGCLAKPSLLAVPVILYFLDRATKDKKTALLRVLPLAAIALGFAVLTTLLQWDQPLEAVAPIWARPLIALDSIGFYVRKLVVPFNLYPDYGRIPTLIVDNGHVYYEWLLGCTPLAISIYLAWRKTEKQLLLLAGAAFLLIAPVSGLVSFRFQDISTVADHYMYPVMIVIGAVGAILHARSNSRGKVVAGVVVAAMTIVSFMQVQVWQDTRTLADHVLKRNPQSSAFLSAIGDDYAQSDRCSEALPYYERTIKMDGRLLEPRYNYFVCLFKMGRRQEAIDGMKHITEVTHAPAIIYRGLARMLLLDGRAAEAEPYIKKSAELGQPLNP